MSITTRQDIIYIRITKFVSIIFGVRVNKIERDIIHNPNTKKI